MTDALLASILDRPEDDLPRLVYADWLDENGEHERSEFIRVQCELAKLGDCGHAAKSLVMLDGSCNVCSLQRRERELLGPWKPGQYGENQFKWFVDNPVGRVLHAAEYAGPTIRRGFVESVRLPLAAFLGGACGQCGGEPVCDMCDGTGSVEHHCGNGVVNCPNGYGDDNEFLGCRPKCEDCSGSGRTEGIAKRLFASQPIQNVIAIDCHPVRIGSVWNWMQRRHEPESPHFVGQELFDLLDLPYAYVGDERMDAKCAPSEKEAMDGLSRAMVRLGRSLANLRPLEPVA